MDAFRFAVIADAHFHDIEGDYGIAGPVFDGQRLALRSFAETRLSTRVFNESHQALLGALEQVRARGIRHVVLLGDYSDDGQVVTMARLQALLREEEERHGLRFYALPGNHDIFALKGRHHSKEFIAEDGSRITASSLPDAENHVPGLYSPGYPDGLEPMAAFGYFRRPDYLHWESPFGPSDRVEDRTYEVVSPDGKTRHRLMDASYLVEPVAGVWFMMIDANVFAPIDDPVSLEAAFEDSTSAGWNGMLRHKPFIFDWIADVHARANRMGKKLLMFSHYPALDPFEDRDGGEAALFGVTSVSRRTPQPEVAGRLLDAGGGIHFSGHLHVHRTTVAQADGQRLVNVAVPSLVAFPAAWKQVTLGPADISLEDVPIGHLACDPRLMAAYRMEAEKAGEGDDPCFSAETYGGFLKAHMRGLAAQRFIPRDWPEAMAGLPQKLSFAEACSKSGMAVPPETDFPLSVAVGDWYMLRYGGAMARPEIDPVRLAIYDRLPIRQSAEAGAGEEAFLATLLTMLGHFARHSRQSVAALPFSGTAVNLSAAE